LPQGFEINSDQTLLTFNPEKAAKQTTAVTVTVKLENYPKVSISQEITAIVDDFVAVPDPIRIPKMTLDATINQ